MNNNSQALIHFMSIYRKSVFFSHKIITISIVVCIFLNHLTCIKLGYNFLGSYFSFLCVFDEVFEDFASNFTLTISSLFFIAWFCIVQLFLAMHGLQYSELAVTEHHWSKIIPGRKELSVSHTTKSRKCKKHSRGILIGF